MRNRFKNGEKKISFFTRIQPKTLILVFFCLLAGWLLCTLVLAQIKDSANKVKPQKTGQANFKELEKKEKELRQDSSQIKHIEIGPEEDTKPPKEETMPPGVKPKIFKVKPLQNDTSNIKKNNPPKSDNSAGFPALIDNINSIPPDMGGAAGPNHVVTALNSQVGIQDKSGTSLSTVSLSTFFSTVSTGATFRPFDPKVVYDPYAQRWIITAFADPKQATSAVLIAVSNTNDPTGMWTYSSYDVDATNTNWLDFPIIGFNKNWVVITGNLYAIGGTGGFISGQIYVFDKSALYAGATSPSLFSYASGYRIVPPVMYDNITNDMTMVKEWSPSASGGGTLRLFTISGTPSAPAFTATMLFPGASLNWQNNAGSADFEPQQGSANKIQANNSHLQNAVLRNGFLWCTQTIFLPSSGSITHTAIQWWQINPLTGVVNQFGRIDDATGIGYAFPSISVNAYDDALIGYSRFSGSQFVSANYSFRLHSDPINTFQPDVAFRNGLASYFKTYSGTQNRWGDYSSTAVDPDEFSLWTIQEYAETPTTIGATTYDRWGTEWNRVTPPVPELYVKDRAEDNGAEPDPSALPMWQSQDIWLRQSQDDAAHTHAHMHENAEYRTNPSNPNYVYVEVHNRGGAPSLGTEQFSLYWAKAGSALAWPASWDGSSYFDPGPNTMVMGAPMTSVAIPSGTLTIPVIPAGGSVILEFPWMPPNPATYSLAWLVPDQNHFCLLGRITTSAVAPYGMTLPETSDLNLNVKDNNNIIWKNIEVYDLNPSDAPQYAVVGNMTPAKMKVKFKFEAIDADGNAGFLNKGKLKVEAMGRVKEILKQTHIQGDGIKDLSDGTFEVQKDGAALENITLEPKDMGAFKISFIPNSNADIGKGFAVNFMQIEDNNGMDHIIGGETFVFGQVKGFGTSAPGVVGVQSWWHWWYWLIILLLLALLIYFIVRKK